MTRGRRLALIGAVVVIAIIGFVIAKSGSDDKTPTTSTTSTTNGVTIKGTVPRDEFTHLVVKDAKPVGGVKKIKVGKGDDVKFDVTSDVADEIHVHGYDFMKDVKKGGKVSFDFPAKLDGIFEIELEERSEQIASLQVEP